MEFHPYIPGGLSWPFLHAPALHIIAVTFGKAALTMTACGCGLGLIHLLIWKGAHNET